MEGTWLILKNIGEWCINYSPIILLVLVIAGYYFLYRLLKAWAKTEIEVMAALGNMIGGSLKDQIIIDTLKEVDILDPANKDLIYYLQDCIETKDGMIRFMENLKNRGYVDYEE